MESKEAAQNSRVPASLQCQDDAQGWGEHHKCCVSNCPNVTPSALQERLSLPLSAKEEDQVRRAPKPAKMPLQ